MAVTIGVFPLVIAIGWGCLAQAVLGAQALPFFS